MTLLKLSLIKLKPFPSTLDKDFSEVSRVSIGFKKALDFRFFFIFKLRDLNFKRILKGFRIRTSLQNSFKDYSQ